MKASRIGSKVARWSTALWLLAILSFSQTARSETFYLGLTGYPTQSVASVNKDGSGFATVAANKAFVFGALAVDSVNNQLYFGDASNPGGTNALYRSNLDGSGLQTIATLDSGVNGVYADAAAGKLYIGTDYNLYTANLDGSNKTALSSSSQFDSVQVYGGKIYWTDTVNIYSENTDGTGKTTLVNGGSSNTTSIVGFDVEGSLGKLFYSDQDHHTVSSANLDGTGVAVLASNQFSFPGGTKYDSVDNRVYFGGGRYLDSVNLDGSGFTSTLISGIETSNQIETIQIAPSVVPEPSSILLCGAGLGLAGLVAARRSRGTRPQS